MEKIEREITQVAKVTNQLLESDRKWNFKFMQFQIYTVPQEYEPWD